LHQIQESKLPTLDTVVEEKRKRLAEEQAHEAQTKAEPIPGMDDDTEEPGSVQDLEDEADQQGAFNPETGEINWDCPCLGGMAHGPCGEEFKAAFSCFVYSKEEPKGMECIDKFK
jgi:mitochondrial intermembrane space import and assembly protein 40